MAVKTEILSNGNPRTSIVEPCGSVSARVLGSGCASGMITAETGSVGASRQADGYVCVSLAFKPSNYAYLRVHPNETMWIDVGAGFDYNVFSNTDWIVS